jgi:hypothetical protein
MILDFLVIGICFRGSATENSKCPHGPAADPLSRISRTQPKGSARGDPQFVVESARYVVLCHPLAGSQDRAGYCCPPAYSKKSSNELGVRRVKSHLWSSSIAVRRGMQRWGTAIRKARPHVSFRAGSARGSAARRIAASNCGMDADTDSGQGLASEGCQPPPNAATVGWWHRVV